MKPPAVRRRRALYPVLAVALAACPPTMPPMAEVTVSGMVRHADGSPAAGADVSVTESIGGCDQPAWGEFAITTEAGGGFSFPHWIRLGGDSRCFAFVARVPASGLRSDTVRVSIAPARSENEQVRVSADLTLRPVE